MSTLRQLARVLLFLSVTAVAFSEPPVTRSVAAQARADQFGTSLIHARAHAKRGDVAAIENELGPFLGKKGTPRYHLNLAGRLVEFAGQASHDGDLKLSAKLCDSALSHLAQAEKIGRDDTQVQLAAAALAAFVHERFRGDATAAKRCYENVLSLSPNSPAGLEGLERLNAKPKPLPVDRAVSEPAKEVRP